MRATGLVRVTVAAPRRRIDIALPEQSLVAELLPGLLQHAGESLADEAAATGGWMVRRADGSPLELARNLGSHRVRDGEVLYLVSHSTEWPEMEYDDVVDAIASGAGRTGQLWSPRHTRVAGLTLGAAMALMALAAVLRSGPPWQDTAIWSLGIAVVLLIAGCVSARALGDSSAGALLGALALPFSFAGGALLLAGGRSLPNEGALHLLTGSAGLLLAGLIGFIGIADRLALFTGAVAAGVLGLAGGWLATTNPLDASDAAAVVVGALLAFSPLFGSLAVRLGRVPMPVLPRTTTDLIRDDPQAPRAVVYQAVIRADALLTGLLLGTCLAATVCQVQLILSGRTSAVWYVAVLAVGFLLRARLYPAVRHRLPMLLAGAVGIAALALGPLMAGPRASLSTAGPLLLLAGGTVMLAGILTSTHPINPYTGRYAEVLELIVVLAVVPVCCAVLGVYGVMRGFGG